MLVPEGTVPLPVPFFGTVRVGTVAGEVVVIVTGDPAVNMHVPVPEHEPPDQPENVEPVAGVAVSVTIVPLVKFSEQSMPQVMPAGIELTQPAPVPVFVAVTAVVVFANVAVTLCACVMLTMHVPVPGHDTPVL